MGLIRQAGGFGPGYTRVTALEGESGIELGILRLGPGASHRPRAGLEAALLLLEGEAELRWGSESATRRRGSVFDEPPVALHWPAGTEVEVGSGSGAELALLAVESRGRFEPRLFEAGTLVETEHRGRDELDGTAHRLVRTIFDARNRPEATLVLGEVVAPPGRWSSYPPHHHEQPEVYHYRFTEPEGYGHGELGDEVWKLRQNDTLEIVGGLDHAQVAAPGYGMYYIWAIRHLPGRPYGAPTFAEEHRWLLEPGGRVWSPPWRSR